MEISAFVGGLGPRTPGSAGGARQGSALHDSHKSPSPLLCTSRKPPGQRQQLRSGRGASAPPICLSHSCCINTLQGMAWAKPVTLHPSCRGAQGRNARDPAGGDPSLRPGSHSGTCPHCQGPATAARHPAVSTARDQSPCTASSPSPQLGSTASIPFSQSGPRLPPQPGRLSPVPRDPSPPPGARPSPRPAPVPTDRTRSPPSPCWGPCPSPRPRPLSPPAGRPRPRRFRFARGPRPRRRAAPEPRGGPGRPRRARRGRHEAVPGRAGGLGLGSGAGRAGGAGGGRVPPGAAPGRGRCPSREDSSRCPRPFRGSARLCPGPARLFRA